MKRRKLTRGESLSLRSRTDWTALEAKFNPQRLQPILGALRRGRGDHPEPVPPAPATGKSRNPDGELADAIAAACRSYRNGAEPGPVELALIDKIRRGAA